MANVLSKFVRLAIIITMISSAQAHSFPSSQSPTIPPETLPSTFNSHDSNKAPTSLPAPIQDAINQIDRRMQGAPYQDCPDVPKPKAITVTTTASFTPPSASNCLTVPFPTDATNAETDFLSPAYALNGSLVTYPIYANSDVPGHLNGVNDLNTFPTLDLNACMGNCTEWNIDGHPTACDGVSYIEGTCYLKNGVGDVPVFKPRSGGVSAVLRYVGVGSFVRLCAASDDGPVLATGSV